MHASLNGELPVKPRKLTGDLLELADRQSLELVEISGGHAITRQAWDERGRRLPPGSGEVVTFVGKTMVGISVQEVERFLRADAEYLHGPSSPSPRTEPAKAFEDELREVFPGTKIEHVDRAVLDPAIWKPCDPECKLASGKFAGGPLDGQRRPVPERGPSFVRYREGETTHLYAIRRNTKRSYAHVSPC